MPSLYESKLRFAANQGPAKTYCGMVPLIDPDQIRFDTGMVQDGGDIGGKPDFVTEFQYLGTQHRVGKPRVRGDCSNVNE